MYAYVPIARLGQASMTLLSDESLHAWSFKCAINLYFVQCFITACMHTLLKQWLVLDS